MSLSNDLSKLKVKEDVKTLLNKCYAVRVQLGNRAYRVFSVVYDHPSKTSEDNWIAFSSEGKHPIIIDKETMSMISNFELQWLTKDTDSISLEPSILGVELTQKN